VTKAAAEVSIRCARKWVARYRADRQFGLLDRPSTPSHVANRTPEDRVQAIAALRRLRFTGPEIAEVLGMTLSTVSGILTRIGLGKLGRLGLEPARRYERARPGELVHVDVKKLGRIQGGAGRRVRRGDRRHYTPRVARRRVEGTLRSVDEAIVNGVYESWTSSVAEPARLKELFASGVCDCATATQQLGACFEPSGTPIAFFTICARRRKCCCALGSELSIAGSGEDEGGRPKRSCRRSTPPPTSRLSLPASGR